MADAVGLSIEATRFTGVLLGRSAVTRQSVPTLYGHRSPEVGVPSENPTINERGLVITDFVERVATRSPWSQPTGPSTAAKCWFPTRCALLFTLTVETHRPRLIPPVPPIPTIPGLPPLVPRQGGQ